MLACLLVDHRPVASLVLAFGLVPISLLCVLHARNDPTARELMLDLGVMAICMLAMVPWASVATGSSSAMPMSSASMTALDHGAVSVSAMVIMLATLFWAIARVRLLLSGNTPHVSAIVGAVVCSACLAWMLF